MGSQLGLNWSDDEGRLEREARQFHEAHPGVYDLLVKLARRAMASGSKHYGMKALWEVARWHSTVVQRASADDWKLNNNFTAWYARHIMASEPDLVGFFETRQTRFERDDAVDGSCGPQEER